MSKEKGREEAEVHCSPVWEKKGGRKVSHSAFYEEERNGKGCFQKSSFQGGFALHTEEGGKGGAET